MEKQKYDWTQFTLREVIHAPVKKVYNAWTVPLQIEKWFLSSAVFTDTDDHVWPVDKNIEAGLRYAWQWYGHHITDHGVVLEANGRDKLRFTFVGEAEVTITLEAFNDKTVVVLRQANIPDDEEHRVSTHLDCSQGWLYYLTNLKSVLQGGQDLRNKDEEVLRYLKANPVAALM